MSELEIVFLNLAKSTFFTYKIEPLCLLGSNSASVRQFSISIIYFNLDISMQQLKILTMTRRTTCKINFDGVFESSSLGLDLI